MNIHDKLQSLNERTKKTLNLFTEHIHCTKCGQIINEPHLDYSDFSLVDFTYYNMKICKACVVKEGLTSLKKPKEA